MFAHSVNDILYRHSVIDKSTRTHYHGSMEPAPASRRKPRSIGRVPASPNAAIKIADEVWIATALLHREQPDRRDFTTDEIIERARQEAITSELRPGLRVYVLLHCVANYPPNPARYRVLFATGKHTRRLFRQGDAYNDARRDSSFIPERAAIPTRYHALLDWYASDYSQRRPAFDPADSILALSGLGKELWAGEDPDEYVRRLREDWD
jgi:hypothetical protein